MRDFFGKLYSFDNDINFRKGWRVAFVVSFLILATGVAFLLGTGLKLGIDFKGGTSWQFPTNKTSVTQVRNALKPLGAGDATIQTLGSTGSSMRVEVSTKTTDTPAKLAKAEQVLAKVSKNPITAITGNESNVGPSWGHDVSNKAIHALLYFFIVIAIFITVSLQWQMAVAALLAMVHDVLISVGVYAILQIEVTPGTVVAFLTILGYSLYDTIVVFDKMRDNQSKVTPNGNYTYTDMVNLSLNQTIVRSINTTMSALIPVMSILVIGAWIMGAVTLEEFGLALLVGLFVGAYSSVFIASPIVATLKEREPRNKAIRKRLDAARSGVAAPKSGSPVTAAVGEASDELGDEVADDRPVDTLASGAGVAGGSGPYSANHPPRPRKKGKKR